MLISEVSDNIVIIDENGEEHPYAVKGKFIECIFRFVLQLKLN